MLSAKDSMATRPAPVNGRGPSRRRTLRAAGVGPLRQTRESRPERPRPVGELGGHVWTWTALDSDSKLIV
jgi:hypothetical protein